MVRIPVSEKQIARELKRKTNAWNKNRIEDVITLEFASKLRKKENTRVLPFLKPINIVKKLGTKAQPWLFHEIGELLKVHPLQPEIDIFHEEFGEYPTDIEFPKFYGIELKYFAPTAHFDINALLKKSFYEGFGQALGLLTLGLDYVSLWHFFDKDILNKFLAKNHAKMCQHVISTLNLPIGYRARWVKVDKKERKTEFSEFKNVINIKPKTNSLLPKDIRLGSPNVLVYELDPLRLSVIRRAFGLAAFK